MTLEPLPEYRQSILSGMETCPRRTRFAIEAGDDSPPTGNIGASGHLGTLVHEVFARILRALYVQGEQQMPTQEAVEVMYEVMAESSITLPAQEREDLRWLTIGFCEFKWNPKRILALEERLTESIVCQDGKERTVKGQPDVIMADPPDGGVIVDYKSGRGTPKAPRGHVDGELVEGKRYLSDRGHFQLDTYGLLVMRRYPSMARVTLRELHLRSGEIREASLTRDELEHVERELGDLMMRLERGIAEGPDSPVWEPKPGRHCLRQCPVAESCPVPLEQRGIGTIDSPERADELAQAYVRWKGLYTNAHDAAKAYHEDTGYAPRIDENHVLRWDPPTGRGRKFGIHAPEA